MANSRYLSVSGWLMLTMVMLLMTEAAINDHSQQRSAGQGLAAAGAPVGGHNGIPTFNTVKELCQWLCDRQSPNFNYGCPPSCDGSILDSWSKRATRRRRFDDFSFDLDDYLFMKLLGRNFGERA